jgi:hypothetical protein
MAIFNTTLIISGIQFLIIANNLIRNNATFGVIGASNDNYGINYHATNSSSYQRLKVMQLIQTKSLVGKIIKNSKNYQLNDCVMNLYDKKDKNIIISKLNTYKGLSGDHCYVIKSIFAEIRQQKMLRKIYRLSYKVNLFKKRLDRLTNKTL